MFDGIVESNSHHKNMFFDYWKCIIEYKLLDHMNYSCPSFISMYQKKMILRTLFFVLFFFINIYTLNIKIKVLMYNGEDDGLLRSSVLKKRPCSIKSTKHARTKYVPNHFHFSLFNQLENLKKKIEN